MTKIVKNKLTLNSLESQNLESRQWNSLRFTSSGYECNRQRFYYFHWGSDPEKISAKTSRIFRLGTSFEKICIEDLNSIGIEVFRRDKNGKKIVMTGKESEEQELLKGVTGHEKGYPDGRCLGVVENPKLEHLLEMKTMNAKNWNFLWRKRNIKISHPRYYAQTQRYMIETKLKACLFIAINKDNSEYYIEIIQYNEGYAKDLIRKEQEIFLSDKPPEKTFSNNDWQCKVCHHNPLCNGEIKPLKNCRSCIYSDLKMKGKWVCTKNKKNNDAKGFLSFEKQKNGCKKWANNW